MQEQAKPKSLIRTLVRYYKPHKKLFITDMIAALLLAVCDLFYPMITRNIINHYVPENNMKLFLTWGFVLLGIYIIKCGLNYFMLSWGHIMGVRMQGDMRRDLFHHMQRLLLSYFDENQTGSLMSRIVNDLEQISELAHHGPEDLFISIISFLGAFILLAQINLPLTCIIFIIIPIIVIFINIMRSKLRKVFKRRRETTAAINAEISNSLSGIRVSKAFTNASYEEVKFGKRTDDYVNASATAYKSLGIYHSGVSFFLDLLTLLALVASGIFVFYGKINIGDFTAFLLYIGTFTNPIRKLNAFVEQFQDGMSGFRRFAEVMNIPMENNPKSPKAPDALLGNIAFNNVSFSYEGADNILQNVNLNIPAGKTIALVGPSGGGKTTLCHLIPRFYIPQQGTITLDGIDVQKYDHTQLRKAIGIVQQDVFIFTGSIKENIAYGKLNASDEEIQDAAKQADLHDFISNLPRGYDTYIGERGAKLSGGQKQRISIARVFLKNPPVLILDEATSALDNITEQAIQAAFERLAKNRTTLVVAHRLSTIKNADEIIVLNEDGVAENGTHTQLMQKENGIYRHLYNTMLS